MTHGRCGSDDPFATCGSGGSDETNEMAFVDGQRKKYLDVCQNHVTLAEHKTVEIPTRLGRIGAKCDCAETQH